VPTRDPRFDAYIENAAPFARPILTRLRETVHAVCPDVEETFKWRHPTFAYKGLLCSFAAFKQHCTFGFWRHQLLVEGLPKAARAAVPHFDRLTSVDDLPPQKALERLIKDAVSLNERGIKPPSRPAPPKGRTVRTPPALAAALRKDAKAQAAYAKFSYSHKKEYVEWITEAKTDATRDRRIATAVEWIAGGKPRNWKYM
jgi:uncharacterized protein YdeI (YjbR/CyaY-like superfamily)